MLTKPSSTLLLWSPRVLGILVCAFLSLFALDAFDGGKTVRQALVGGGVFTGLATAYAYFARGHLSWIVAIAAPLLIVGLLFLWSWRHHAELRSTAG